MKTPTSCIHWLTAILLPVAFLHAPDTRANIVGYVTNTFHPGANLFGNPFDASGSGGGLERHNDLNTLFVSAPEGATVSLWDPATQQFAQTSTFAGGAWTHNLSLTPGMGGLLTTPGWFATTFYGEALNASGAPLTTAGVNGINVSPPAPFSGPAGIYLLSSKLPVTLPYTSSADSVPASTTFNAFDLIVGRAPLAGESVTRLDAATQAYVTTTFDGLAWNNGTPALNIGEAAFFNIGPVVVPEPGGLALALCATGLGLLAIAIKRRPMLEPNGMCTPKACTAEQ